MFGCGCWFGRGDSSADGGTILRALSWGNKASMPESETVETQRLFRSNDFLRALGTQKLVGCLLSLFFPLSFYLFFLVVLPLPSSTPDSGGSKATLACCGLVFWKMDSFSMGFFKLRDSLFPKCLEAFLSGRGKDTAMFIKRCHRTHQFSELFLALRILLFSLLNF